MLLQQSGDLGNAQQCYERVLAAQPNHADALHLLGMVVYQSGQPQPAIELIERAIKINKKAPAYFTNLGLVYQGMGQYKEAEKSYRKALAIKPDFAETHHNLGIVLHMQQRVKDAEASFRRAVTLKPKYAEAWINFGNFMHATQRYQEAEQCFEKAIVLNPDFHGVYYNLAHCLRDQGKHEAAIAAYRTLLAHQPGHVDALFFLAATQSEQGDHDGAAATYRALLTHDTKHVFAWNNLGNELTKSEQLSDAESAYRSCLTVQPDYAQAHYNLGNLLADQGRDAEAQACYREAIRLQPEHVEACCALGLSFKAQHKLDDAADCFRQAIRLRPDASDAHLNLAMTLLLAGNLQEGWQEYEWRLAHHPELSRDFRYPVWQSEDLRGKTILVWGERGFGDEIQFARYLPALKALGARVVFECREELHDLFAQAAVCDRLIIRQIRQDIGEKVDYQIPLLSLPARLNATEKVDDCAPAYLSADPIMATQWQVRLQNDHAYRVGLVWAGNPQHKNDRNRSASLPLYAPLASVSGCSLYSLQKGSDAAATVQLKIHDYSAELHTFSDTAALISNLDLVICVDTSVAHLAGALGKQVWLLLPFDPDWRWGLRGTQTAWYPDMTLFRQPTPGDWPALIDQVKSALAQAVK
jgi:tetratricopeptide (TPR) repeat protein